MASKSPALPNRHFIFPATCGDGAHVLSLVIMVYPRLPRLAALAGSYRLAAASRRSGGDHKTPKDAGVVADSEDRSTPSLSPAGSRSYVEGELL